MPRAAWVMLCYGPYESNGAIQHRSFCLQGLQTAPKASGHRCVLEETSALNRVELEVNRMVVFTCDIKQLQFGGDGKLDPFFKEGCHRSGERLLIN